MARRLIGTYVDPTKLTKRADPPAGHYYVRTGQETTVHSHTTEAKFTCETCGKTVGALTKVCPYCGKPISTEKFEYDPQGRRLSDADLLAAGRTLDHQELWTCTACGTRNEPVLEKCSQCGKPKESPKEEASVVTRPYASAESQPTPQMLDLSPYFGQIGIAVGAVLLAIMVFFGVSALLKPKQATVPVASVSWSRSVSWDERQYIRESGWDLPTGADKISSEPRIKGYVDVFDHYEDVPVTRYRPVQNGTVPDCHPEPKYVGSHEEYVRTDIYQNDDGTIDHVDVYETVNEYEDVRVCVDVPVYIDEPYQDIERVARYRKDPINGIWYEYYNWKWIPQTPYATTGTSVEVFWPKFTLGENQRESGRAESYNVVFGPIEDKSYSYTPSGADEFVKYNIGTVWKIEYNALGVTKIFEEVKK